MCKGNNKKKKKNKKIKKNKNHKRAKLMPDFIHIMYFDCLSILNQVLVGYRSTKMFYQGTQFNRTTKPSRLRLMMDQKSVLHQI